MQTRYDLLVGYAALFGLIFLSLVLPIPATLNMIATSLLVIYLAAHQAAQTTREAKPFENSRKSLRKGDIYLLAVLLATAFITSFIVFILPNAITQFLFKATIIAFGLYTSSQRTATIVVGACTEEQEHNLRQRVVKMDLKEVNKTLRPIVEPLQKTLQPVTSTFSQLTKLICKFIQVCELVVVRLLDGTEEGSKQEQLYKEIEEYQSTASPSLPLPSSTSTGTNFTWNPEDQIPFLLPSLITIDGVNMISFITAAIITLLYIITGFWLFNNIITATIALYLIELVNLGSFVDGLLTLGGFFIVDLIHCLAKSPIPVDPIELQSFYTQFTSNIPLKFIFSQGQGFAMLGLGSIIIPALFLSLLLRFDIFSSKPFKPANDSVQGAGSAATATIYAAGYSGITISTPFFNLGLASVGLGALINGLLITYCSTTMLNSPLLITIPLLIATTAGVAFALGGEAELKKLLAYIDTAAEPAAAPSPSPHRSSISTPPPSNRNSITSQPAGLVRTGSTLPGEPQTIIE